MKLDTKEAKKHYLKSLENMMKATKDTLLANGISYHLFNLEDPIGEALQSFLKIRNRLI